MSNAEDNATQIADDARKEFDLGAFLRGSSRVVETVTVYPDEVAGNRLGGHEVVRETAENGAQIPKIRSWGLKGEYSSLSRTPEDKKNNAKRLKAIEKECAEVLEQLEESSLTLELHSIPTALSKGARRAARSALDITEKGIPDSMADSFVEEISAQYLALSCGKVTRGDGAELPKLTIEGARDLADYLPRSEHGKLLEKVNDVLFASHISTAAVEDADF